MAMGLGLGLGLTRGNASLDPESLLLFAAMTTPPTEARKSAIDTLIKAWKSGGVWTLLDYVNVYAAADSQAARLNWKNPGTLTAAAVNSPVFAADQGYTFDGATNYLSTGFTPSSHASAMTGTSMMMGVYERTNAPLNARAAGTQTTSTQNLAIIPRNAIDVSQAALDCVTVSMASPVTDSRGLFAADTDGTNGRSYRNGVAQSTPVVLTTPGSALPSTIVLVGGLSNPTNLASPRAAQEAALFVGAKLSAAQHLALYTPFQAYMTTLGSAV